MKSAKKLESIVKSDMEQEAEYLSEERILDLGPNCSRFMGRTERRGKRKLCESSQFSLLSLLNSTESGVLIKDGSHFPN